jgi:exonuclease V gamma subunit
MSVLCLTTDPLSSAASLAGALERQEEKDEEFAPAQIIVPHQHLGRWLRLWLARRHGVAINLRFRFLEEVLWDMLRCVDPRVHEAPPELLDGDTYRLLVLAVLFGDDDPDLTSLQRYFRSGGGFHPSQGVAASVSRAPFAKALRRSWRRAWHLSDVLASLIRDYEYHRQDALIQPWIQKKLVLGDGDHAESERSQWAVFDRIIQIQGGKRALLNEKAGRNFKTLPQYAMEVLEILREPGGNEREAGVTNDGLTLGSTVHFFGLTQISALHVSTLRWLGRFFDLRMYHFNPLVARLSAPVSAANITCTANTFREDRPSGASAKQNASPGDELLRSWARAGAESFWLMAQFLQPSGEPGNASANKGTVFNLEVLKSSWPTKPSARKALSKRHTVLHRLQQHLMGQPAPADKLPQDRSLQIVGCPGGLREVETVYHSILHNLQTDRTLQLTDIAVLVSDMSKYRPLIQAVFDRVPRRISHSLLDYSAAGLSLFGKAVLAILDLALESSTRARVLSVLLNPCFLARLKVDRSQALIWARWAEELGIYQGWDAQDKKDQGYIASSRYSWRLGLQRLRLGRFMEAEAPTLFGIAEGGPGAASGPAPRYGEVMPFADINSRDGDQLDAFSRAVEGLLPTMAKLRDKQGPGKAWADTLRELTQAYLDIPTDRPEEAQVRDRLLAALEQQLPLWDHVSGKISLPLCVVREFIQDQLAAIEGRQGEYLEGGVTIAALGPQRPMPFKVLYVMGLGENTFPGRNTLSSLDLRGVERKPGDVRPAETARFLFLEALLAARDKIYLLHDNRDVQKDQKLLPAIPVTQLQRYLNRNILNADFVSACVPLHDHDVEALAKRPAASCDVGVLVSDTDRLLALAQAKEMETLGLDFYQEAELNDRLRRVRPNFAPPLAPGPKQELPSITIKELARFLENPALAALKRHVHLAGDDDGDAVPADEPFVSSSRFANRLRRQVMQTFVFDAAAGSLTRALRAWPERFRQLYEEEGLRCRMPEHAFGAADREFLYRELCGPINGPLAEFLRNRDGGGFCGPILLGETITPVGAHLRFPALKLNLPVTAGRTAIQARVCGFVPMAWADAESFEILVLTSKADLEVATLSKHLFEPVLFYLALRANPEEFAGAESAQRWLRGLAFHVYVLCKEELYTYSYSITEDEAGAYLENLAADFLDPTSFDLLPFELIAEDTRKPTSLSAAYVLPDDQLGDLPTEYYRLLAEKIEQASDTNFGNFWHSPLLDLARVQVPEDAFAKIRRRFRLLDRGPQAHRDEKDT